jgi:hypothetical protein
VRTRRTRFGNLSPKQQAAQLAHNHAEIRVSILTRGIGDYFKTIYDLDDFNRMQRIIDSDLVPALVVEQQTLNALHASYKLSPGRTRKTRRKDPKPTEAKK